MKSRGILYIAIASALLLLPQPQVRAQMSDDAVIAYVKQGMASGKSQAELTRELTAKGVTKEQVLRIRDAMQVKATPGAILEAGVQERNRRSSGALDLNAGPVDFEEETFIITEQEDSTGVQIYGHNLFLNRNLTFIPNENIATPENYRLGPGDEIIIDIWGTNQNTIRQSITPDGFINIEGIGLIYLGGYTVKEAEKYVRKQLNNIYSVDGDDAQSDIKLTLGALRTIQVNVVGEVNAPGTYHLSSLSSPYHALYRAGGFTDIGSLRNIAVIRSGEVIGTVDVYQMLVNGKPSDEITLQDGDIVLVPTYEMVIDVAGNVKRPMKYEMKDGETVKDILDFSGGFKGDSYTENINLVRRNGREYQVYTVREEDYGSFKVMDADSLTIGTINDRYGNRIEVKGAVYRPGVYQLSEGLDTVKELIEIADGLKGDAFLNRAIIIREKEDYSLETIAIDLGRIMDGTAADLPLKNNDILYISSIHDLTDFGTITVAGEVASPGTFAFSENTTIEDAIIMAGGLLESASTAKIEVSRRVKNPSSLEQTDEIGTIFTFALKDGYILEGERGFVLEPYDRVYVRRSPGYVEQANITVSGEVVFPGAYVMTKKEERLSDLVEKAGGLNRWAYARGAKLMRQMDADERARLETTASVLTSAKDSVDMSTINMSTVYAVGIDLEAALADPGCDADIVMREGDRLIVPEYNNTIKISGNVLYPNVVTYNPEMTVSDYVQMAGGYGYRSKKNKTYIVYMNGTVARARRFSKGVVEPGSEIVVPKKRDKDSSLQEILSISTTAASLGTMIATIGNLIK